MFDGPAVVHYLQPGTCATFDDYANDVFVLYMVNELSKVSRVDIVRDIYRPDSLKGTTRERRRTGTRRRVHASTRIPGNWQSFLRNDENKQELFRFLATKLQMRKRSTVLLKMKFWVLQIVWSVQL